MAVAALWQHGDVPVLEGTVADRLTTAEATAVLLTALVEQRRRMTTAECARMVGRSRSATYRLLCQVSGQAPITVIRGWWQRV